MMVRMTVPGRMSPTRIAQTIGVETGEALVFGIIPIGTVLAGRVIGRPLSYAIGVLGAVAAVGTAGVVAGRRGYPGWQCAWYILVAVVAFIFWGFFVGGTLAALGAGT
jgi:hypothetical protein